MRRQRIAFITCSLCRHQWTSTRTAIKIHTRMKCPHCEAMHDTKKMQLQRGVLHEHYETGVPLPESA